MNISDSPLSLSVFLSVRATISSPAACLLTLAVRAVNGQAVISDSGDHRVGQDNLIEMSQEFIPG